MKRLIKNPLTPIQLSIDRLKEKYSSKIGEDKSQFNDYLQTINRQIKDIENLVNEFSNFARMPRPIFKKINIIDIITRSVDFVKMSSKNKININTNHKKLIMVKLDLRLKAQHLLATDHQYLKKYRW